jgi:hypothetical protein
MRAVSDTLQQAAKDNFYPQILYIILDRLSFIDTVNLLKARQFPGLLPPLVF